MFSYSSQRLKAYQDRSLSYCVLNLILFDQVLLFQRLDSIDLLSITLLTQDDLSI